MGKSRDVQSEALVCRLIAGTYLDSLTQLFNRSAFVEAANVGVLRARAAGRSCAVLHIDIDGFSRINHALGASAGDRILVELADRLRTIARPPDVCARGGGDEFLVLLSDVRDETALLQRIERLREALRRPVAFAGHELAISTRIGFAVHPADGATGEALINAAATALVVCQRLGVGQMQRYAAHFGTQACRALDISQRLRRAAIEREFHLVFEPFVDCRSGRLTGAEALLRWQPAPDLKIPPGDFIPVAEQNGMIVPIGRWLLDETCRWLARWRAQGALDLALAVNISARQLREPDFVDTAIATAARHGVPLSRLIVELTETAVLEDVALARATMERLVAMGVTLAIDDFGTGNATLATLQDLPAGILKIDRRFVAKASADKRSRQLVDASVAIARSLELRTVAEGIETRDQLAMVRNIGCDAAQGFFFTPSLAGAAFEQRFVRAPAFGRAIRDGDDIGTRASGRRRRLGLGVHAACVV